MTPEKKDIIDKLWNAARMIGSHSVPEEFDDDSWPWFLIDYLSKILYWEKNKRKDLADNHRQMLMAQVKHLNLKT